MQTIEIESTNTGEMPSVGVCNEVFDFTETGERNVNTNEKILMRLTLNFIQCENALWSIPVPEHFRLIIIKKGDEVYQNKERSFESTERLSENSKRTHQCFTKI